MSRTLRFGLFGYPVKHSLSPVMHGASFRSLGLDAEYLCFEVPPEALEAEAGLVIEGDRDVAFQYASIFALPDKLV